MAQPTGTFNKGGTAGTTGAMGAGTQNKDKGNEGVLDKAKDVASNVASTAGDVASNIGQKAEDATTAVGGGIKSLGGTVREYGPHGGFMGSATSAVADTLETSGKYLSDQGLSGIGDDLTNLIRRNPIPALLVGVGVGFLLAQMTMNRR